MRNFSQRKFSQCVLMLFLLEGFVFFEGDAVVEGLGAFGNRSYGYLFRTPLQPRDSHRGRRDREG